MTGRNEIETVEWKDLTDPQRGFREGAITLGQEGRRWKEPADDVGEIWWRSANWAVTDYGLEEIRGRYPIEKSRLMENAPDWSWVAQVTGKEWCSPDEFATAWLVSLAMHGIDHGGHAKAIALGQRWE